VTWAVFSDRKLTRFSPSGSRKAVLTTAAADNGSKSDENGKGELLRLYDGEKLLYTFDLKKLDKHKEVYTNGCKFFHRFILDVCLCKKVNDYFV